MCYRHSTTLWKVNLPLDFLQMPDIVAFCLGDCGSMDLKEKDVGIRLRIEEPSTIDVSDWLSKLN